MRSYLFKHGRRTGFLIGAQSFNQFNDDSRSDIRVPVPQKTRAFNLHPGVKPGLFQIFVESDETGRFPS
jgi:hypothetical protein